MPRCVDEIQYVVSAIMLILHLYRVAFDSDAAFTFEFHVVKDLLLQNIEQVNRLQQDAEAAIEDLASGKRDDIANVMIAKQKADLAFKTLLQVRNKLMTAYEEIQQMRV